MSEFIQTIDNLDKSLLPVFNGGNSMFIDELCVLLTNGLTWIPLYVFLLILVVKNNEKLSQVLLLIAMVALALLLSDGLSDFVMKPLVARPRPVADPSLKGMVTVVNGYVPAGYSFFSAHAANTFAVAVLFSLIVRNTAFSLFMTGWAALNSWTRLYLGVHYFSDIIVGCLWGIMVGFIVYAIYRKFYFKISERLHYISSQYTRSGYSLSDIDRIQNIIIITIIVELVASCFLAH